MLSCDIFCCGGGEVVWLQSNILAALPRAPLDCYVLSVTVRWVLSDIILVCSWHATAFYAVTAGFLSPLANATNCISLPLWSLQRLNMKRNATDCMPHFSSLSDKNWKSSPRKGGRCMQLKMQPQHWGGTWKESLQALQSLQWKWNRWETERLRETDRRIKLRGFALANGGRPVEEICSNNRR